MLGDDTCADRSLLQIAEIDEPHNSGMRSAKGHGQRAEILVESYDYLAVLCCVGKDLIIAWIGAPFPDPLYLSRSFRPPRR
jgi:hypothetical protein